MALHGDISVNRALIGRWMAQRIVTAADGLHTYRWEAQRWSDGRRVDGELQHAESEGAIALAAKVLTAAHEALGGES